MNKKNSEGFTLIELLVVITIIVVLLALLMPAMDKAIYEAELAVCAANQHSIATGAQTYAMEYKRLYPFRKPAHSNTGNKPSQNLCDTSNDDRPTFRPYFPINANADPLAGKVDLNGPPTTTAVWGAYSLWFGWGYLAQSTSGVQTQGTAGEKIMRKLGDGFTWQGDTFTVLVSDFDLISQKDNLMHGAHPDNVYQTGITTLNTHNYPEPGVASWWQNLTGQYRRSPVDMNYALADGSMNRLRKVTWDEGRQADGSQGDRIARVPEYPYAQGYSDSRWTHVPVK